MKKSILIITMGIALAACSATKTDEKATDTTATAAQQGQSAIVVDLFDKEWKLKELNGKAIVLDTAFKKEPQMVFQKEGNKLVGNGGCNSFSGSYQLKDANGITLSEGAATMMACPNLKIEGDFFAALKQVRSYRIENSSLLLDNEKKEVLAKLELAK
ncbi:META domain-containing protein [Pedobacter nanyangensis]|uniref:META domain-containing protein n=1 Tax=Pedobacter nanyangensis TaxID=1562389 RepID=UPI000DE2412D|nr:META domain-containing protein [Pedobacter nanyangensis]